MDPEAKEGRKRRPRKRFRIRGPGDVARRERQDRAEADGHRMRKERINAVLAERWLDQWLRDS